MEGKGSAMRILGLDPGIATVGFGILDADRSRQKLVTCGVITTPAHTPLSSRLDQIYTDLEELIRFFRNPAGRFFSRRLEASVVFREEDTLPDVEPGGKRGRGNHR